MKKITLLLLIIAIVLQISKVVYSNLFITSGIDLNQILTKEQALEKENVILGDLYYKKTSYLEIEKKAFKRGFTYNSNQIIMSKTSSIAFKQ